MKIKEKLKQFGILVIRTIWPSRARKSAQHLGILVLGLGVMFGVSQANSVRQAIAGLVGGETTAAKLAATTTTSNPTVGTNAAAAEVEPETGLLYGTVNIVDLIEDSEIIIQGMVKEVSDGFENGIPYTQVTVRVDETLRGKVGEEYTFRQFGLTKPKKFDNGKTYLGVTPEGWSKYEAGEATMLFLHKRASQTGLQTTAGLGQGKVVFQAGNAVSQFGNDGLFENVDVDAKLLNDRDKRLLATKKGAVNAEGFKSFVRRAVKDKWIEGGKMRHGKK